MLQLRSQRATTKGALEQASFSMATYHKHFLSRQLQGKDTPDLEHCAGGLSQCSMNKTEFLNVSNSQKAIMCRYYVHEVVILRETDV